MRRQRIWAGLAAAAVVVGAAAGCSAGKGDRAAAAVGFMEDHGFTHVVDAGGIQDAAAATGLGIVY